MKIRVDRDKSIVRFENELEKEIFINDMYNLPDRHPNDLLYIRIRINSPEYKRILRKYSKKWLEWQRENLKKMEQKSNK